MCTDEEAVVMHVGLQEQKQQVAGRREVSHRLEVTELVADVVCSDNTLVQHFTQRHAR